MKFTTSLILATTAAAAHARVIERQLVAPQAFGLQLVSSDPSWNNKFIHPTTVGSTTLTISTTTDFADTTFMVINSNLFHGSDAIARGLKAAISPVSAAALPSYFKGLDAAKMPLYFAPVEEIAGGKVSTPADGFELGTGFAITKDRHLTFNGTETWIACDGIEGGGEFGRIPSLYIAKGDVPQTKGCASVKLVQA